MATFDSIFPTFLAKCGELHTLLLSVAFALFVTGIIVTVSSPLHAPGLVALVDAVLAAHLAAGVSARLGKSNPKLVAKFHPVRFGR